MSKSPFCAVCGKTEPEHSAVADHFFVNEPEWWDDDEPDEPDFDPECDADTCE